MSFDEQSSINKGMDKAVGRAYMDSDIPARDSHVACQFLKITHGCHAPYFILRVTNNPTGYMKILRNCPGLVLYFPLHATNMCIAHHSGHRAMDGN